MLQGLFVIIGGAILIFGPFPPLFPFFNQVLGLAVMIFGPATVYFLKGR